MDKYYCWVCDFSKISGEGNLANLFINKNFHNNYLIYTPSSLITNKKFKNILNYKYISPFIGIVFCWYLFIKKKKIAYINYLPLWNFFIFALLPPKTLFGPITGGANFKKNNNIIRRLLFPIFYKLSEFFLIIRGEKVYFSTDLLKKYLSTFTINKSKFNYVFKYLYKRKPTNKDIDFLIYYRKHKNKIFDFPYLFIKKLRSRNYKIHIIGDKLNIAGLINHGYIKNHLVKKLLKKTRYSICSNENIFSLFTIECINSNTLILVDKFKFKKKEIPIRLKTKVLHIDFEKCFQNIFQKKRV